MNILAKEQEKIFETGISEEDYQKRNQHFLDVYFSTRAKEENNSIKVYYYYHIW